MAKNIKAVSISGCITGKIPLSNTLISEFINFKNPAKTNLYDISDIRVPIISDLKYKINSS